MFFRRQSHDGSQWVSVIQDGAVLHAAQVAHKAGERPRVMSLWQGAAPTLEAGLRSLRTSPLMKKGGSLVGVLDRTEYRMQAGLLVPLEDESLTTRATREALAKLDADPARLLS